MLQNRLGTWFWTPVTSPAYPHFPSERASMKGFIVKDASQLLGRIEAAENGRVRVRFFDTDQDREFAARPFPIGVSRFALGPGASCRVRGERCSVKKRKLGSGWTELHRYEVMFDNGRLDEAEESEVLPLNATGSAVGESSPLAALQHLQPDGHTTFACREALLQAYLQALRGGLGVRALLSSRIDLRPHQAYVAGVVLLDRQQRYLLADEVGLGKTIEAGIVIHDLLIQKPEARILVLCPGALTQQWLCELYAKFCGRWFRLPEWSGVARESWQQVIFSFAGALRRRTALAEVHWDLVVVDEAHHLLAAPELYRFVQELSLSARGFLLLSALPAQHREEEYLRLLALLEPGRYRPDEEGAAADFRLLYERQRLLGSHLSWIGRRVGEVASGQRSAQSVIERVQTMAAWAVLEKDEKLQELVRQLDGARPSFTGDIHTILHHVGDTHRIHRRILRNRRARLVDQLEIERTERQLHRLPYKGHPLELDALDYAERLLRSLQTAGLREEVLLPLARLLFQSAAHPDLLADFLAQGAAAGPAPPLDLLPFEALSGYAEWPEYSAALWSQARPVLPPGVVDDALRAARRWRDAQETSPRFAELRRFLRTKHQTEPNAKLIIFAGFPGLAERLHAELTQSIRPAEVSRFIHGMETEEKEKEVRWFARDPMRWLLITDETGGEGRNFQFAAELLHFDLPWNAARVEQRIGRLDRLGRDRLDVISNVLSCTDSAEEALLQCYSEGFELFTRSISGLEFALRDLEREMARTAITDGAGGLATLPPRLKSEAAAERAQDENAEVMDEASNERRIAEAFRSAQSTPAREAALETAFAHYFKHLADHRSVHFCREADYPDGIVLFHPADVRGVTLDLPRNAQGTIAEHRGTFYRTIAQERPDLEFFSVGNPLFDAVCASLSQSPKGRTYAVECRQPAGRWRGFEFVFRVVGGRPDPAESGGLRNQLDRIFAFRSLHIWVGDDLTPAPQPEVLLRIRKALQKQDKDRLWWNLTKEKAVEIERHYAEQGWETLVEAAAEFARNAARERFSAILMEVLQVEFARLDEQERQLRSLQPAGWNDELAGIHQLREGINRWEVELDSVGFLSVNGGILHARG